MYHNIRVPDSCLSLWQTCQTLVPELLKNSIVKSSDLLIRSDRPIDPKTNSVYLIKSGTISEKHEGKVIVNYEEGDLIGLDGLQQKKITEYENEFAVTVDEYDGQQFLDGIFSDKNRFLILNQFLSCLNQSFQLMMCHQSKQDVEFNPEYRYYNKGDVIIEENTEGDEVFTLLAGTTQVRVDNTVVGEIGSDEIFGAIAALTNTKRNASIVATSDCETIVVKSESFRSLLVARPDTIQKLIHDMARTIVSSNEKILELTKGK